METVHTGGRPLTRAALAGRKRALDEGRTIPRAELSAAGREAGRALNLRPALRSILAALCAVGGEQEWERLVVWPSNAHLCAMTGLSERALRYGLADLVRLELVVPRDSANGKRYAIRAPGGAILDAYGFDLTPVVVRRGEWTTLLQAARLREEARGRAFDRLTCDRRALGEALDALARYPAVSSVDLVEARAALEARVPRRRSIADVPESLLEAWSELRIMAEERFYLAASGGKIGRHIEQDTGSPTDSCTRAPEKEPEPDRQLDLAMVAAACPVLSEMGLLLRTVSDMIEAGRTLRPSIGAHPSAWEEACEKLGQLKAALLVMIVAQILDDDVRGSKNRIENPGGYFRQLVRLTAEGRYGPEFELMAMRRRKMT